MGGQNWNKILLPASTHLIHLCDARLGKKQVQRNESQNLNVLRKFWNISGLVWSGLVCLLITDRTFLDIFFLLFWYIWDVQKHFWMFFVVLRYFGTILWCFETLLDVLGCFRTYFFFCFGTFCPIQIHRDYQNNCRLSRQLQTVKKTIDASRLPQQLQTDKNYCKADMYVLIYLVELSWWS